VKSHLHGAIAAASLLDYVPASTFRAELAKLKKHAENAFLVTYWRLVKPRGTAQAHQRQTAHVQLVTETQAFKTAVLQYLNADVEEAVSGVFEAMPRPLPPRVELQIPPPTDPKLEEAQRRGAERAQRLAAELQRTTFARGLAKQDAAIQVAHATLPTLDSLVVGRLYTAVVRPAFQLERRLLPSVPEIALLSERLAAEARAELALWLRLVRLCVVAAVLGGIPYRKVWGEPFAASFQNQVIKDDEGVYGTSGYWLSGQLQALATDVRDQQAFAHTRDDVRENDWLREIASADDTASGTSPFPFARLLSEVAFEPGLWRSWARMHPRIDAASAPCRARLAVGAKGDISVGPDERGRTFPFQYERIPEDLCNPGSRDRKRLEGGPAPDHLFARPLAMDRYRLVKRNWDFWRGLHRGLAAKPAPEKDEGTLEARITAGSLEFGGAHPPHTAHRNGAHFDVVVRGVLPLTCKTKGVMLPGGEGGFTVVNQPAGKQAPGDSIFLLNEPEDPTMAPPEPVKLCAAFAYPVVAITYKDGGGTKALSPRAVAVKMIQCVLLTFPSQILFADWPTLADAWNQLHANVAVLVGSQDAQEDEDAARQLEECLRDAAPKDLPEERVHRCLVQDDAHNDHWHLSYMPHDLEQLPEGYENTLRWIGRKLPKLLK